MSTGHEHGGAAERGCHNDKRIEVPRYNARADDGTDHCQDDTEDIAHEVIRSKYRREPEPDRGAR